MRETERRHTESWGSVVTRRWRHQVRGTAWRHLSSICKPLPSHAHLEFSLHYLSGLHSNNVTLIVQLLRVNPIHIDPSHQLNVSLLIALTQQMAIIPVIRALGVGVSYLKINIYNTCNWGFQGWGQLSDNNCL